MNRRRKYSIYSVDSPQVVAILKDVIRSSKKSYYRKVDGRDVACAVRRELLAPGMCTKTATGILPGD
jgi:hypothetical protein